MRGRHLLSIVATLAFLLGAASAARAGDFCFESGLVLKAFKVPAKGKCRPYQGFFNGPQLVQGVACTSSDNAKVYLSQTWLPLGVADGVGTTKMTLDRATLSGSLVECVGGGCSVGTTAKADCVPSTIPIP